MQGLNINLGLFGHVTAMPQGPKSEVKNRSQRCRQMIKWTEFHNPIKKIINNIVHIELCVRLRQLPSTSIMLTIATCTVYLQSYIVQ